jgi:hypothetical protein
MLDKFEQRSFSLGILAYTNALSYVHPIAFSCYYGAQPLFTGSYWINLFTSFNILINLVSNVGFFWTDLIMLIIATP